MSTYRQALIAILVTFGILSWGAVYHSGLTKNIISNAVKLSSYSGHLSEHLLILISSFKNLNDEIIQSFDKTESDAWTPGESQVFKALNLKVDSIFKEIDPNEFNEVHQHLQVITLPLMSYLLSINSEKQNRDAVIKITQEINYFNAEINNLFNLMQQDIKSIESESTKTYESIKFNYLLVLLSLCIFLAFIIRLALKVFKLRHQTKGLFLDMKQPISLDGNDEMSNLAISLEKMRQEVVHRRVVLQEERHLYKKHLKLRDESITHLGLQIRNSLSSIIGTLSLF